MKITDEKACVANINSLRTRRILTHAFKDEEGGVLYTEVLVYLTVEYLNQIKKQQESLYEKYNGFIVKTYYDAEWGTGINYQKVRLIYRGLAAAGLIEMKKGGQDNKTCVKVNLKAVDDFLEKYEPKFDEEFNKYVEKQKNRQQKRIKQSENKHGLDLEKVNELSIDNDFEKLSDYVKDHNKLSLIYGVNHYYRQFTSKAFIWKAGDLNTMLQPWKDRWSYEGAELGLAIAVYRAIHDNSNLYFGQKFKQHFSIQKTRYDIPSDVVFDNIFQMSK